MILQALVGNPVDAAQLRVKVKCPRCRHAGTFDSIGIPDFRMGVSPSNEGFWRVGHRVCPDPACKAHVIIYWREGGNPSGLIETVPPVLIDFDPSGIPETVVRALEEAICCHGAKCFKAAAMMVRKALETLCEAQGAKGNDLKQKVIDLGSKIVIPKDLMDGLDNLRLLGNDAAHVEARVYDEIGADEVETALEFSKEVLKACYQYAALVARLKPR